MPKAIGRINIYVLPFFHSVFDGRGIIVAHVCATSMHAQNHWTGDDAVVAVAAPVHVWTSRASRYSTTETVRAKASLWGGTTLRAMTVCLGTWWNSDMLPTELQMVVRSTQTDSHVGGGRPSPDATFRIARDVKKRAVVPARPWKPIRSRPSGT